MKLMEPRAKTKLKRNYVMLKKRNPRLYNHIFVCALNFYFNFKSRTCQCHNHFSLVVIFSYIRISHFKLLKQTLYGYTTASILPPPPPLYCSQCCYQIILINNKKQCDQIHNMPKLQGISTSKTSRNSADVCAISLLIYLPRVNIMDTMCKTHVFYHFHR